MDEIERWTIWKRVGKWDDAILGPDTGTVQGDPGIVIGEGTEVVRVADFEFAVERASYFEAEVGRLQRLVDEAFGHASGGDAHSARVSLTEARWGRS